MQKYYLFTTNIILKRLLYTILLNNFTKIGLKNRLNYEIFFGIF